MSAFESSLYYLFSTSGDKKSTLLWYEAESSGKLALCVCVCVCVWALSLSLSLSLYTHTRAHMKEEQKEVEFAYRGAEVVLRNLVVVSKTTYYAV